MTENKLDTETLNEIITTLQKYCHDHFPREEQLKLDREDVFPEDLIRKMLSPEVGLHLLFLPEEYGGFGGGAYDIYRVSEEMAKIDLGMATAFLAISLGTDPLRVGGTDSQKEQWMTRIAEEGLIVAYGATEPSAGSDLGSFSTKAEPIQNGNGEITAYRLNGVKQFITNGGVAELYSILARAPGGPSFFMVERGTAGLVVGKSEEKHGIRLSNTSQVILEDVMVPKENLVGLIEGQGLTQAVAVFGYTRLMVAAFGLGGGEAALHIAVQYAQERHQFGKPLIALQGYTHKLLVPHAVHLEAARAYIEEIAHRLDQGESGLETEGAIAKLFATEVGNQTAEAAIQALGGYGYTHEYEVEKIKRDVRITTIYEGTSEIMQETIGKDRWRKFLQTRGGYLDILADEVATTRMSSSQPASHALAHSIRMLKKAMEYIRLKRLTRQQYIVFVLADMLTGIETALALCRRAATLKSEGSAKAAQYCAAASRIYAAEVASSICRNIPFYLAGFGAENASEVKAYQTDYPVAALNEYYLGFGADMDYIVQALIDRA